MGFLDMFRGALGKSDAKEVDEIKADNFFERRSSMRVDARPGTRILIVDDSKTIVFALKKMLSGKEFILSEAYDGEACLEMVRETQPELIFLDIVMPGANGFAVLRAIRRDPATRNIPVIMMSGNENATEQFFGSKIPADDFMKKPFSRQEVYVRIAALLDESHIPQRRKTPDANN
jgi:twitching motility two-component system response regulator PilH